MATENGRAWILTSADANSTPSTAFLKLQGILVTTTSAPTAGDDVVIQDENGVPIFPIKLPATANLSLWYPITMILPQGFKVGDYDSANIVVYLIKDVGWGR